MSASSHAPAATGAAPWTRFDPDPAPSVSPSAMKMRSADTFRPASTFITNRPGPTPRIWTQAIRPMAASATMAWREIVSGTNGTRDDQERRRVARRRHEAPDVEREDDGARRGGTGKAGDKRRPAGQERGQTAERGAQVHVLATGPRPQRGELGIRHGAGKREQAAGDPRRRGRATGFCTLAATCGGVNRIPPPITFETMIAAASYGPRRRASVCVSARAESRVGGRRFVCAPRVVVCLMSGRPNG